MASAAFLKMNSASGTSVTSVTVSSVSMTSGTRIVVGVALSDPFNAATASSVSIQGAAATLDIALKGTGSPNNWLSLAIWSMTCNTTSTASVVVTLDKALGLSNSTAVVMVNQVLNFNTGTPVGATTSSELGGVTASFSTAATSVNDVLINLVDLGNGVNDRWLQTGSGTIVLYNDSPRPGSSTASLIAMAYNTASGASTTLEWDYMGFDAGPIPVAADSFISIGAVYKTAAGGSTAAAFFAYTRNHLTAGAVS